MPHSSLPRAPDNIGGAGREPALVRAWSTRGWLAFTLLPISVLFALLVWLRRSLFRLGWRETVVLPVPVVVVGNITVGGVGKTPLTIYLVEELRRRGRSPGVVSRGYGRAVGADQVLAVTDQSNPAAVGDEPALIHGRTGAPVYVGNDRVAAAKALLARHPDVDVLVSDDGLQHYRLGRQVEIAVFDQRGAMNGWMLPAGPLREPLGRLQGVDAVVINGGAVTHAGHFIPAGLTFDQPAYTMSIVADDFYCLGEPARRARAEHFLSAPVHAMAGIGHPQRFFDQLATMGLTIIPRAFPDHHVYVTEDIPSDGRAVLITEKDAVKLTLLLKGSPPPVLPEVWVLPVSCLVEPDLMAKILEKL